MLKKTKIACTVLALGTVAFASASQDIVIDAYRVEILETKQLAAGAAMATFGWRAGQVGAAAGGLIFADIFPWSAVYAAMAVLVLIGEAELAAQARALEDATAACAPGQPLPPGWEPLAFGLEGLRAAAGLS